MSATRISSRSFIQTIIMLNRKGILFDLESYSRAKGFLELENVVNVIDLLFPRSIHRFSVLPGHHWTREFNLSERDQISYSGKLQSLRITECFSFLVFSLFSVAVPTVLVWCDAWGRKLYLSPCFRSVKGVRPTVVYTRYLTNLLYANWPRCPLNYTCHIRLGKRLFEFREYNLGDEISLPLRIDTFYEHP